MGEPDGCLATEARKLFSRASRTATSVAVPGVIANDLAADKLFPRAGLLHLVADRDFETSTDQTRNIAFGGMIRHATHGNGLALFAVAGSEGNLQLARSDHGIFVE